MLRSDPVFPEVLKRGIQTGFRALWRGRGLGMSLGSLVGIAVLFHLLLLGLVGISAFESMLLEHLDVRIDMRPDAGRSEVQQFVSEVQELPYVEQSVYITREQALDRAESQDPTLKNFLEKTGMGNPFPDRVGVILSSLDEYPAFSDFLAQPKWQDIVDPAFLSTMTRQEQKTHELLRVAQEGRNLVLLLLLIACGVVLTTIVELTRRNALFRSEEVLVERLVGARSLAVFVPFATEATVLLWLSAVVGALALFGVASFLPSLVPSLSEGGVLASFRAAALPSFSSLVPPMLAGELVAIPLLAMLGTWLGIRSILHSPKIRLARH